MLELLQHVEVKDRFIDRDGDELLHLERKRLPQLLLGEPGKDDLADDHALVADRHVHLLAAEPAAPPQLVQGLRHGLRVLDLAVLDGSWREVDLGRADERRVVGRAADLRRAHGRRSHVETDPRLAHA